MQPNGKSENVRTLFDESPIMQHAAQQPGGDEGPVEHLVAGRESASYETPAHHRFFKILAAVVLLTLLIGSGGFLYANRFAFLRDVMHDSTLQALTSQIREVENRVAGLLASSVDEQRRSEAALSELRHTDDDIKKTLGALTADFNDLKSTVDKNSGAIQAIDAKLEAAKVAAKKTRQVTVVKAPAKRFDDNAPAVDAPPILPTFALVAIDTYAYQNFAVVRSAGRGLKDLGTADSLDGWRVVEFDMLGQRVAFESQAGVLRWLTTQP